MQQFYLLHVALELPIMAPGVLWAVEGIAQVVVVKNTNRGVRLQISIGTLVFEKTHTPSLFWRRFVDVFRFEVLNGGAI